MRILKAWAVTAAGMLCIAPAFADCAYPKKPDDPPNGAKATQEEMLTAQRATKQFNVDVESYLACLSGETETLVSELGPDATPEQVQKLKNKQAMKHNAAVDDLQKHADAFNKSLRAFKSK